MFSTETPYNSSNTASHPLPVRRDSLSTRLSSIVKPKETGPIVQSREDLQYARAVLDPARKFDDTESNEETRQRRRDERERELTEVLGRMANWVDELSVLLQQAHKNQSDLETALTLTRSNLQLALANNEMLEEALKRGGSQDVGWRRWSDREGMRRTSAAVNEYDPPPSHDRPQSVVEAPTPNSGNGSSRFFNFKYSLQRTSSSSNVSPTSTRDPSPTSTVPTYEQPPPPPPPASVSAPPTRNSTPPQQAVPWESIPPHVREQALMSMLSKEHAALQALTKEKSQLESELENLSQALFEEANKMVSKANRKLAETEEELRIATEQKEALRSALRIVEGENGKLRQGGPVAPSLKNVDENNASNPPITLSTAPALAPPTASTTSEPFWSPLSPAGLSTPSSQSPGPSPSSPSTQNGDTWSGTSRIPRSRSAVRNELEQAMWRMQTLVSEDGDPGAEEDNGDGTVMAEDVKLHMKRTRAQNIEPVAGEEKRTRIPSSSTMDR